MNGSHDTDVLKRSSGKPTYTSPQTALDGMKSLTGEWETPQIAMPKIGCGLLDHMSRLVLG